MKNFKTYQLAKQLYSQCQQLGLKGELRDQLQRASLSIVLNLAEGSGKMTMSDQKKFYTIAFGSLRETQAILDILENEILQKEANQLGGSLRKLIQSRTTLR